MKNRHVGLLMIGMALAIVIIIFLFQGALKEIVSQSCTGEHAISCPMYDAITKQTYLALTIVGIIIIVGIALFFTKPDEKIIVKRVKEKLKPKVYDLSELREEEVTIFNMIKEQGAIFQADVIEKSGFGKAKISRIVDRLEGKSLVERKRRGMTNVIVLKE